MGLDSVDLLVTVEDKFGIIIPDIECEQIYTVQELADAVYSKVSISPTDKCLTQSVFYRVKKTFERFNLSNEKINPNTHLWEILAQEGIKKNWDGIEKELGLK